MLIETEAKGDELIPADLPAISLPKSRSDDQRPWLTTPAQRQQALRLSTLYNFIICL